MSKSVKSSNIVPLERRRITIIYVFWVVLLIFCLGLLIVLLYYFDELYIDDLNLLHRNVLLNHEKSVLNYLSKLCPTINVYVPTHHMRCPRKAVLTINPGTGLGEAIFQYVILWTTGRRMRLPALLPHCLSNRLRHTFTDISLPILNYIAYCPKIVVEEPPYDWDRFRNVYLMNYQHHSPDQFFDWMGELRREFILRDELQEYAQEFLHDQVASTVEEIRRSRLIFVGVSVKRAVFASKYDLDVELDTLGTKFIFAAMEYFENKYRNVIFLVVSDSITWCLENLKERRNVVVKNHIVAEEKDLALLVACNHTIITTGNIGLWGAILAGGEIIAFDSQISNMTLFNFE